MSPAKSDLLQGTLDLLILQVVALGPLHGYAIAQRLQQISQDILQVQQGSLYPALHRLEARGWLSAQWKATDTGRDAKTTSDRSSSGVSGRFFASIRSRTVAIVSFW